MSAPPPRTDAHLLRTFPGRLFLVSSALLVLLYVLLRVVELNDLLFALRRVLRLSFLISVVWLVVAGLARSRRTFLWRVRRRLIVTYLLLGAVPVLLVGMFVLVGGVVMHMNVAAYVFNEGYQGLVEDMQQMAETSAGEVGRNPATTQAAIERKITNLAQQYPQMSMAVVPLPAPAPAPGADPTLKPASDGKTDGRTIAKPKPAPEPIVRAGPWKHGDPPAEIPEWLVLRNGFKGTLVRTTGSTTDDQHLLIRAVVLTPDRSRVVFADLPIDADIIARLHDRTDVRMGGIALVQPSPCGPEVSASANPDIGGTPFRRATMFMDCTDWATGTIGRVSVHLDAPLTRLYGRIASAQQVPRFSGLGDRDPFMFVLFLVGSLLLIVQGGALAAGGMLARTITGAVHELFVGTERVREGDFAHRIKIESKDQLGDLADSFNRMSASIEHLLHVQREKQRLDDELRIAREIQKSLLPAQPPIIDGISIADLCEPAREVGGDYYDFFEIGPRQLGVLIADVSGKGTSAALYMAELKGLMLALSHTERSPKRLLCNVNRLLAEHLDNRSFITMTYAVFDLEAGTLTCARAGHTPIIVVSSNGGAEVVVPNGMVLGLRLPGASERFEQMLEEYSQPIAPGDVIVLYTDGITEAMDTAGEMFGDAALARVLESQKGLDAAGIRERVLREVKAFVGSAEPHDDMTMVVLKLTEPGMRVAP